MSANRRYMDILSPSSTCSLIPRTFLGAIKSPSGKKGVQRWSI